MEDGIIWRSFLTYEMVKGMDTDKINELVDELNASVMRVCVEFGLE